MNRWPVTRNRFQSEINGEMHLLRALTTVPHRSTVHRRANTNFTVGPRTSRLQRTVTLCACWRRSARRRALHHGVVHCFTRWHSLSRASPSLKPSLKELTATSWPSFSTLRAARRAGRWDGRRAQRARHAGGTWHPPGHWLHGRAVAASCGGAGAAVVAVDSGGCACMARCLGAPAWCMWCRMCTFQRGLGEQGKGLRWDPYAWPQRAQVRAPPPAPWGHHHGLSCRRSGSRHCCRRRG